jgi:hypothetical protein
MKYTNKLQDRYRSVPYHDQVFNEVWDLLNARLRQGYHPIALERVASLELSRSAIGSNRYDIFEAILYLLHVAFPTKCVVAIPGVEATLQRILDRQVGKHPQVF